MILTVPVFFVSLRDISHLVFTTCIFSSAPHLQGQFYCTFPPFRCLPLHFPTRIIRLLFTLGGMYDVYKARIWLNTVSKYQSPTQVSSCEILQILGSVIKWRHLMCSLTRPFSFSSNWPSCIFYPCSVLLTLLSPLSSISLNRHCRFRWWIYLYLCRTLGLARVRLHI